MRPVSTDIAGSSSRRNTDGLEIVHAVAGVGEVADLDRGAQRVLQRDPLQLERQARKRVFDVAEAVARLRPFALAGIGERAPQRRIVLIADHRIGEILLRRLDAAEHDIGDRAQHQRRRLLGGRALVRDGRVEHRLGLGVHLAREIEARQIDPRRGALQVRRVGRGANQFELPLDEIGLAVEAPRLGVEGQRARDRFAAGAPTRPTASDRRAGPRSPCRPTTRP